MRNKKNKGFLKEFSYFIFFVSVIFALFKSSNINTDNIYPYLLNKSNEIKNYVINCYENNFKCGNNNLTSNTETELQSPTTNNEIDNNKDITDLNTTSKTNSDILLNLNSLNVVESYDTNVLYKRTEWKHWINYNSSCWNTREEALYRQSDKNALVLLDKNNKQTNNKDLACSIEKGRWIDPYTKEIITDPSKTDVDHTIPLAATSRAGGQKWTKELKEQFANDLDHLVVTSQKANRQKGDKTPSQWLPENENSWCNYSKIYINTSKKYNLNISKEDKKTLENILQKNNCTF